MKKLCILLLFTALPVAGIAQKQGTHFEKDLQSKGYTEVEWTYFKDMMAAAKELDVCSRKPNFCNLTDPIKNKKIKAVKQVVKGWSWGESNGMLVQKKMAGFEKAISENKKNKVLSWIEVLSAFKKYPGYSYEAMAGRMTMYIDNLEVMRR